MSGLRLFCEKVSHDLTRDSELGQSQEYIFYCSHPNTLLNKKKRDKFKYRNEAEWVCNKFSERW